MLPDFLTNQFQIGGSNETNCLPFCGSRISLVSSSTVKAEHPGWIYLCDRFPDCDIRCHTGTITPVGTLADADLRRWRTTAHQQFDQLWRSGKIPSRTQAYGWLAATMQLPQSAAHFGLFDQQQCQQTSNSHFETFVLQ